MATEVIQTENSTYEVDYDLRLMRRVWGRNKPTAHFKHNGLWHPFIAIEEWWHGTLLIHWTDGTTTRTSRVLK